VATVKRLEHFDPKRSGGAFNSISLIHCNQIIQSLYYLLETGDLPEFMLLLDKQWVPEIRDVLAQLQASKAMITEQRPSKMSLPVQSYFQKSCASIIQQLFPEMQVV